MKNWLMLVGGLIGIGTFVGVALYITGSAMPGVSEVMVERTLPAPPERVLPLLVGADGLGRWLGGVRPAGGPTEGVGTRITLDDPLGASLTVTQADPRAVGYEIARGNHRLQASLGLFEVDDGTRIQWFETRDIGTPFDRWWERTTGVDDQSTVAVSGALDSLQRTLGAP